MMDGNGDGDGEGRMGYRNQYGNFPANPKTVAVCAAAVIARSPSTTSAR